MEIIGVFCGVFFLNVPLVVYKFENYMIIIHIGKILVINESITSFFMFISKERRNRGSRCLYNDKD